MSNSRNETKIRTASANDLDAIEAIEAVCFSDAWSKRAFSDYFENTAAYCLVLESDGVIEGYICTYCLYGECEIVNLAVSPKCRRRGYAQALLQAILSHARSNAFSKVMLEVRRSNTAAAALYEKNGFLPIAVRKNYYTKPKEDAILMDLSLAVPQNEGEEIDL